MAEPIPLPRIEQRGLFPDASADQLCPLADLLASAAPAATTSLYIHIPFCFHKCHYCDFYSLERTDAATHEAFVQTLELELRTLAQLARPGPLRTIFLGGGTPSLLAPPLLERIFAAIRAAFDCSLLDAGKAECTVECNPETVSEELAAQLAACGVNRASVGAQSFHSAHLRTLERWHEPESVARAVERLRGAGVANVSLDLIYAVPGQSLDNLQADLEAALALGPNHLSCYCLTYEPNTALTARLRRGEFSAADDATERAMFDHVVDQLACAGFERYEVSNFARPGFACEHNLTYWRQGGWLAAGPAAAGHVLVADPRGADDPLVRLGLGARWRNVPRLSTWAEAVRRDGLSAVVDVESAEPARALRERIMLGLRLAEGLDEALLLQAADALDCAEALADAIERFVEQGLLERRGASASGKGRRLCATSEGLAQLDGVAAALMATIPSPATPA